MKSCPRCGTTLSPLAPEAGIGDLTIDLYGSCTWQGERVRLTANEALIVYTLASSPDVRFKHEALMNIIGSENTTSNVSHVLVSRIRKAFKAVDPEFDRIDSDRSRGSRGICWRISEVLSPDRRPRLILAPV